MTPRRPVRVDVEKRHRWKRRLYDNGSQSRYWDCTACGEFILDMKHPAAKTPRPRFDAAIGPCKADRAAQRKGRTTNAK
jgi:hypothetical protein